MKKLILLGIIVLLSLSACVPDFLKSNSTDASPESVNSAATTEAENGAQAAQTFEALASPTIESVPTDIPPATEIEESIPATEAATIEATVVSTEIIAATATLTPAESTPPAETATETLVPIATSIYASPTSPVSVGMPPDDIPRYKIRVISEVKGISAVSFHGITDGGYHPIIEYHLSPWEKATILLPEGDYTAIVYIRNTPFYAYFSIHKNNKFTLIIKKDKIKLEKH